MPNCFRLTGLYNSGTTQHRWNPNVVFVLYLGHGVIVQVFRTQSQISGRGEKPRTKTAALLCTVAFVTNANSIEWFAERLHVMRGTVCTRESHGTYAEEITTYSSPFTPRLEINSCTSLLCIAFALLLTFQEATFCSTKSSRLSSAKLRKERGTWTRSSYSSLRSTSALPAEACVSSGWLSTVKCHPASGVTLTHPVSPSRPQLGDVCPPCKEAS